VVAWVWGFFREWGLGLCGTSEGKSVEGRIPTGANRLIRTLSRLIWWCILISKFAELGQRLRMANTELLEHGDGEDLLPAFPQSASDWEALQNCIAELSRIPAEAFLYRAGKVPCNIP
jgi:hypothetical protein